MKSTLLRQPAIAALGALALGLALVTPTFAAGGNHVTATVTGGTRSASFANVSMGSVLTSHVDQLLGSNWVLTVDDSSGSGLGWDVYVSISDFHYSGTNGSSPANDIPADPNFYAAGMGAIASIS